MLVMNGKLVDFVSGELIVEFDGPVPALNSCVVVGEGSGKKKYWVTRVNYSIDGNGRSRAEVFVMIN